MTFHTSLTTNTNLKRWHCSANMLKQVKLVTCKRIHIITWLFSRNYLICNREYLWQHISLNSSPRDRQQKPQIQRKYDAQQHVGPLDVPKTSTRSSREISHTLCCVQWSPSSFKYHINATHSLAGHSASSSLMHGDKQWKHQGNHRQGFTLATSAC